MPFLEIVGEEHYAVASEKSNASFNVTMNCKISLLSWGWMNCLTKKKDLDLLVLADPILLVTKLNVADNLQVNLVLMYQLEKLFVALRKLDGNMTIFEDAFRGVGSIEDVIAKAEKMGF